MHINLKEYRITTNMMIINTPENIIQVKDIGNRKFYGIADFKCVLRKIHP